MEALWDLAPLWVALMAVAAVIVALALRARRARAAQAAARSFEPPPGDAEADVLDSSHIGFAPISGPARPPRRGRGTSGSAKQE